MRATLQMPSRGRIAAAVALVAFGIAAWIFGDSFKPASDERPEIWITILACQTVPFVVAVGALFGRPGLATIIGVVLFLLWLGWCAIAISAFGI